ncbi:MAG: RHS repeat-associated core domain-containing protein, partial [Clostridia bacterium]|nr:RHS repeat-associated core domain-containing protein [Clostridia bacterium]
MEYIYHKNIFGDIVAIYQGATKVAEYAYDAYGRNFIKVDIDGIATSNPFRYRGYYWDSDLSLYYLMSRYYDPATSRFINT